MRVGELSRRLGIPGSQAYKVGMREEQIQSAAFRNAQLGSERLRIFGVVGFFTIFMLITVARVFVIRTAPCNAPGPWSLLLAAVVIGYGRWMSSKVQRALRESNMLARRLWVLSTIVETSISALAIAFLTNSQISYRPLASPAVLVFVVFIILSTLRLSPWTGVLSGVVPSGCHRCAAVYLGWRPPVAGRQESIRSSRDSSPAHHETL